MKKNFIILIFMLFASLSFYGATITVTNTNSSGPGSLYQAVLTANQNGDSHNTITFSSSLSYPITINLTNELPIQKSNTTINGLVSGGDLYPDVVLKGNGSINGIKINYSFDEQLENITIRGLVFNNFDRGILVYYASNNIIEYCYFGTNVSGSASQSSQGHPNYAGITMVENSSYNTIRYCVLSGNQNAGIGIFDAADGGVIPGAGTGNIIYGNIIGLDRSGQYAIPNYEGILIINGITDTQVGGTEPDQRNIISGNTMAGIRLERNGNLDTSGNIISGNYIGLNINGNAMIGNGGTGAAFYKAKNNTLAGNVIAGSGSSGVVCIHQYSTGNTISGNIIGLMANGLTSAPNNEGINVSEHSHYTTITSNIISSNTLYGIRITANYCTVKNNSIGLASDYTTPRGNGTHGIYLLGAKYNEIGGLYGTDGNTISANQQYGILLTHNTTNGYLSQNNNIRGNRIGTNATGVYPRGNVLDGILLDSGSSHNTIGGLNNAYRNIISANGNSGIRLGGSATVNNFIYGNYIGTGADFETAMGNTLDGIRVQNGSSNNIIGDSNYSYINRIMYNLRNGITIGTWPTDSSTLYNTIRGNHFKNNGLLAIDLGNEGVTQNDPDYYNNGPNKRVFFPVFGKQFQNNINGYCMPSCTVDVFIADRFFPWEYGQGMEYIGSVVSNSQGRFTFTIPPEVFFNIYPLIITGTATDQNGNTSEFSKNYRVKQKI